MRPRPYNQAGVRQIEGLSLPGKRLQGVTYFRQYWACADSFAYMQMRYFAYGNHLQMAAVPCPIRFTDRQDVSARYSAKTRTTS